MDTYRIWAENRTCFNLKACHDCLKMITFDQCRQSMARATHGDSSLFTHALHHIWLIVSRSQETARLYIRQISSYEEKAIETHYSNRNIVFIRILVREPLRSLQVIICLSVNTIFLFMLTGVLQLSLYTTEHYTPFLLQRQSRGTILPSISPPARPGRRSRYCSLLGNIRNRTLLQHILLKCEERFNLRVTPSLVGL